MTVATQVKKVTAEGNGTATVFSFSPIVIFASTDLVVTKTNTAGVETTLAEGTGAANYSVSVSSYPGTGSITYPADTAAGTKLADNEYITIKRVLAIEQSLDLENQGGYFPDNQETALDKLTMMVLQQQESIDRAIKVPVSETSGGTTPTIANRKNMLFGWDDDGNPEAISGVNSSSNLVTAANATAARTLAAIAGDTLTLASFGITADGTDQTTAMLAMAAALAGSGVTVVHKGGKVRITSAFVIAGFRYVGIHDAEIEAYGTATTAFITNGGVRVSTGGYLSGVTVSTAGTMLATTDDESEALYQTGGVVEDVTVYSQLSSGFHYTGGRHRGVRVYGGTIRGVKVVLGARQAYEIFADFFNAGQPYVAKVATGTPPAASGGLSVKGIHVISTLSGDLAYPVLLRTFSTHSYAAGVLVSTDNTATKTISKLKIEGYVAKAGYYMNSSGVETTGSGSGTNIQVSACPGANLDADTGPCLGYNLAISINSDDAIDTGTHVGAGGDPVAVVTDADNVTLAGHYEAGTVGVSIGETDDFGGEHPALGTIVTGTLKDNIYWPAVVDSGARTAFIGAKFIGEPTNATAIGTLTGSGEVRTMVQARSYATDIALIGCYAHGRFTHDVTDVAFDARGAKLRVARQGNVICAPMLARSDISLNPLGRITSGAATWLRLTDETDVDGHASVGEETIAAGAGTQYKVHAVIAPFLELNALKASGETLADVLGRMMVVIYVKYAANAEDQQLRFGLNSTGVYTDINAAATWSGNLSALISAGSTFISHTLTTGEYHPVTFPLVDCLHSAAAVASSTITGATKANPCVVTSTAHGFANGDRVTIASVAGMTQLNGNTYTVANKTANTFELSATDSSGYGVYTSGGTATPAMSFVVHKATNSPTYDLVYTRPIVVPLMRNAAA